MSNTDFATGSDYRSNRVGAFFLTLISGQAVLFGPTAIAVHNNGYMGGQVGGIIKCKIIRR